MKKIANRSLFPNMLPLLYFLTYRCLTYLYRYIEIMSPFQKKKTIIISGYFTEKRSRDIYNNLFFMIATVYIVKNSCYYKKCRHLLNLERQEFVRLSPGP